MEKLTVKQRQPLRDAVVEAVHTADLRSARRRIVGFPDGFAHEQFQTVVWRIPESIRTDALLKGEGGTLFKRWANFVCGVTEHHKGSYTHEEVKHAIRTVDVAHLTCTNKNRTVRDAPKKVTEKEVCASTLLGKSLRHIVN